MEIEYKGKDLDKDLLNEILLSIIGELFQGDKIEVLTWGDLIHPEIKIKTYQSLGYSEVSMLRHLSFNNNYYFDIHSSGEKDEDFEETGYIFSSNEITITPTDSFMKDIRDKRKKRLKAMWELEKDLQEYYKDEVHD